MTGDGEGSSAAITDPDLQQPTVGISQEPLGICTVKSREESFLIQPLYVRVSFCLAAGGRG
jgi:hypothetical protein